MRKFRSNRAEVKIKDVDHFLESMAGIHQIMAVGRCRKADYGAMSGMNVDVVSLPDLEAHEFEST